MPHFIDRHVAALIGNLGRHDHNLAGSSPFADRFPETAVSVVRYPANAKRLDDQSIISVHQHIEDRTVTSRYHPEQKHPVSESVRKTNCILIIPLVINIENDPSVLNDSYRRIIDAGERIVTLRPLLLGSGAGDNQSAEYDADIVCTVVRRKPDTVQQIGPGVRVRQVDRLLGTCYHDRLRAVLYQVRQRSGRVCHGVRPMAYHKAVIVLIMLTDQVCQHQPLLPEHIRTVQAERLYHIDPAEILAFRDIGQKFLPGYLR